MQSVHLLAALAALGLSGCLGEVPVFRPQNPGPKWAQVAPATDPNADVGMRTESLRALWQSTIRELESGHGPTPELLVRQFESILEVPLPSEWSFDLCTSAAGYARQEALIRRLAETRPDRAFPQVAGTNERFAVSWRKSLVPSSLDLDAEPGTVAKVGPWNTVLTDGTREVRVRSALLRNLEPHPSDRWGAVPNRISVRIGDDRAFVALYEEQGVTFDLLALSRTSGDRFWTTRVAAILTQRIPQTTGPPGDHRVEIVVNGERVGVFGATISRCYVEVFAASTGRRLMQFRSDALDSQ